MLKIGVVIPYYQRDAAVLARALAHVAAQDVTDAEISVVVVDDSSPAPAEAGLTGLGETRLNGAVRVIRRPNGGPGAARNTGLDAIAGAVDAIAFLDSDDLWAPHHLRLAADSLARGADVFFADFADFDDAKSYLRSIPELATLLAMAGPEHADTHIVDAAAATGPTAFASLAATTYLAHTSTIVFRADRFAKIRFAERPAMGEDHVFFLDLALSARQVAFSLTPSMRQGRGVNIYAATREWGTEADIVRRSHNLDKHKVVLARADWPQPTRQALETALRDERRLISWLLVRKAITDRTIPMQALRTAFRTDPASVAAAPFLALDYLASRKRTSTAA
ncbi:MAG: glycosyltransferase family 2 protein [Alphaproteobacteria bacterium]